MKIFTPRSHSHIPERVRIALGLPKHITHGRVLVAAKTKAAAFELLAARHMAPDSLRDPEFRQAMGNDLDELSRVGLLDAPVVLAMHNEGGGTPVIRVEPDSTVDLGELEPAGAGQVRFVPTPAGVDGPVWTESVTESALIDVIAARYRIDDMVAQEMLGEALQAADGQVGSRVYDQYERVMPAVIPRLLAEIEAELEQRALRAEEEAHIGDAPMSRRDLVVAALAANRKRVKEVNTELERLRRERQEFAHRARELDIIAEAAAALDVTPGRVSQLGDEYLVAQARGRRAQANYLPGLWVEIEDQDRRPENWAVAQVVERPADAVSPDANDLWVWVHTNGNTFPVRQYRLRPWSPPCSSCPPEDQLTIRTVAALGVHQVARHGVR